MNDWSYGCIAQLLATSIAFHAALLEGLAAATAASWTVARVVRHAPLPLRSRVFHRLRERALARRRVHRGRHQHGDGNEQQTGGATHDLAHGSVGVHQRASPRAARSSTTMHCGMR